MALLDRQGRRDEVRFFLGGVSVVIVPDSMIDRYLDRNEAIFGAGEDVQCLVIYYTVIQILKYLEVRADTHQGDDRGSIVERTEQVGGIKTTQKTDVSSGGSSSGWHKALMRYLDDPSLICPELKLDKPIAPILIGGVSRSRRSKVIENPDSYGVYDFKSPFQANTRQRLLIEGNYYIFKSRDY